MGTDLAGDRAVPEHRVGPVQPQRGVRQAAVGWDAEVGHAGAPPSHEADPAAQVPVTVLGSFRVLRAARGVVQEGVIVAGVVYPIGAGAGTSWKATVRDTSPAITHRPSSPGGQGHHEAMGPCFTGIELQVCPTHCLGRGAQ